MTNERPSGITILAVLAFLGAILAALMAVEDLYLLLSSPKEYLVSSLDLIGGITFFVLTPAFAWVSYTFWTINLSDWYSSVGVSLLNLALILLSVVSLAVSSLLLWEGFPPIMAVSVIIVNCCIIIYCLLLDKKRAFGSS